MRPTTYSSYVANVECHILPAIGGVQLQQLCGAQINALYAKLGASGKRSGNGLSGISVRHVHAVLHRSLKDAVRWNRLARNPADATDPPRVSANGRSEMKNSVCRAIGHLLGSVTHDRLRALWLPWG